MSTIASQDSADESGQLMQIGRVAEHTGLSINTLRHYDQIGLVPPSARSQGGFRLYTDDDVARLLVIRRMKPLGYSLEQMRELLEATEALSDLELSPARARQLRVALEAFLVLARDKRAQLTRELAYAEEFIDTMGSLAKRTPSPPQPHNRPS